MQDNINKQYQWATDRFADECQKRIGIRPLEDDRLVLNSAVDFSAYIKTYKRLDQSVKWHQGLVDSLVSNKIDTLSRRIIKDYGSHERYIDRVRQRCRPSERAYKANSRKVGAETLDPRVKLRQSDAEFGQKKPDSSCVS